MLLSRQEKDKSILLPSLVLSGGKGHPGSQRAGYKGPGQPGGLLQCPVMLDSKSA